MENKGNPAIGYVKHPFDELISDEIACYEQFLLFCSAFKRLVLQTCKNQGLFGKGLSYKLSQEEII